MSGVLQFETAVDAIVSGDTAALTMLLTDCPELVGARSEREHRSTLLHYVSANGVEDFRQKTPANIVEIARLLLDAGADVNAESEAYGGRATALVLTATSGHPEKAGVQIPLMKLLIARGATLDGPDGSSTVNTCLRNGRGLAAEFLASRGARLDMEGAAGVGRLDVVRSLQDTATDKQVAAGFGWACEFGRTDVAAFLLDRVISSGAPHTGLHWAALSGEVDIVKMLLDRQVPVDVKDDRFHATPLGWALYGSRSGSSAVPPARHRQVIALLEAAGAKV